MKKSIIFLLALTLCNAAWAEELIGKANISKTGNKTHTWILYSIRAPFTDLTDIWIRIDASIRDMSAPPETLNCGLKINMRSYPAYEYAQYRDGALYLYFDRLESETLMEFAIGYEKVATVQGYFQNAALSLKSNEWQTSAKWEISDYYIPPTDSPMRIVIDGMDNCYLY